MKCIECKTENSGGALFCAHCGANLEEPSSAPRLLKCPICAAKNPENEKNCSACGAELRRHHHQKHQSPKRTNGKHKTARFKWAPATVSVVLITGVIGFIAIMEWRKEQPPAPPPPFVETKTNDATLEGKVLDVASKFICSCGTCGEKPLDTCTCDKAAEERQFIRNYLQTGQSPDQVIAAVMKTYGWLKPEFAAKYDSTSVVKAKLNSTTATESQPIFSTLSAKKTDDNKIATRADAEKIFSHFRCPCGQCGMDELKDCTCKHPRGAIEVKSFAQTKIAEGKSTVAQIVDEIDAKYGGRKL
ncbi:MAG: zinc ribbon domain-containing protein [Ignavibacteriae bacterium]|nr:zinc ribbon domain-containing protein [Ignavibacteriota bacterium]